MQATSTRILFVCTVIGFVACVQMRAAKAADSEPKTGVLQFHGTPLRDVVESLANATHQKIFVNWTALQYERVVGSLPVTIDLSDKTLPDALDKLLAEVGGDDAYLGYRFDEGVITVSTKSHLAKTTATQVYDVRKAIKGDATRDHDIAAVIARVRGIDPLSWRDAGGSIGAVKYLAGQLIVTQTPAVQDRIAKELKDVMIQH